MKGEKVAQLELLLRSHPEGMRKAEIARRIGVHRSTVSRYIEDLKQYAPIKEDNNLITIEENPDDRPLELSVYESLAFNMGAKMLTLNTEYQNPHLVSGLRKIAMNMAAYAPGVSSDIMKMAEEIDRKISRQADSSKYNQIMEVLIDGWVSGKIVRITHSNPKGEFAETELAPYFIGFIEREDGRNPISVTGRLRHTTDIVTLEISSIRTAEILNETYTIPDNLKAFKRKGEKDFMDPHDTIPLVMRMTERSALNSFSAVAHGDPRITANGDGTYTCSIDVENSIETMLRIIQCGSSIKIIEPKPYRQKFCNYLKSILIQYEADN